jgi:hypothetical protein
MLFHRSRADAQMPRDFLVAATLHQQIQDLLIAGCDLNFFEINHDSLLFGLLFPAAVRSPLSTSFAKLSPDIDPARMVFICWHLGITAIAS